MDVMRLMHHAIKAERQKAEHANDHAVEFIQSPTFPEQTMRSFVKTNQHAMHEMRRHQDERHSETDPTQPDRGPKRSLGKTD